MKPTEGMAESAQTGDKVTLAPSHAAAYFLAPPRDDAALFA